MNKTILFFISFLMIVILGLFFLQKGKTMFSIDNKIKTPSPVPSKEPIKDFQTGQGVIFKGLYAYGKGTQRNCDMLFAGQTKESCEQSNKDNVYSPEKAEPISTDLFIEDKNGNKEIQVHSDGSENFKIELAVGYHKICAIYQGTKNCAGITVEENKYTDFGLPIMRQ